jgi:hypothetical protein
MYLLTGSRGSLLRKEEVINSAEYLKRVGLAYNPDPLVLSDGTDDHYDWARVNNALGVLLTAYKSGLYDRRELAPLIENASNKVHETVWALTELKRLREIELRSNDPGVLIMHRAKLWVSNVFIAFIAAILVTGFSPVENKPRVVAESSALWGTVLFVVTGGFAKKRKQTL